MYPISVYISMIDVVTSLICLLYHQSCPDPNISRRETSVGNHWYWDLSLLCLSLSLRNLFYFFKFRIISLSLAPSPSLSFSLICTLRVYPSVSLSLSLCIYNKMLSRRVDLNFWIWNENFRYLTLTLLERSISFRF